MKKILWIKLWFCHYRTYKRPGQTVPWADTEKWTLNIFRDSIHFHQSHFTLSYVMLLCSMEWRCYCLKKVEIKHCLLVGYIIMHYFSVPLSSKCLHFRNITYSYNIPWDEILKLKPTKVFSKSNCWLPQKFGKA